MSATDPVYEGFLEKQGHGAKSSVWEKRFARIRGDKLLYGKSAEKVDESSKFIVVAEILSVNPQDGQKNKQDFGFEIVVSTGKGTRQYKFIAENQQSRDTWVQKIQEWVRTTKPVTPLTRLESSRSARSLLFRRSVAPSPRTPRQSAEEKPAEEKQVEEYGEEEPAAAGASTDIPIETDAQPIPGSPKSDSSEKGARSRKGSTASIGDEEGYEEDDIAEEEEQQSVTESAVTASTQQPPATLTRKASSDEMSQTTLPSPVEQQEMDAKKRKAQQEKREKERSNVLERMFDIGDEEAALAWSDKSSEATVDLSTLGDVKEEEILAELREPVRKAVGLYNNVKRNDTYNLSEDVEITRIRLKKTKDSDIFFSSAVQLYDFEKASFFAGIIGIGNKRIYLISARDRKDVQIVDIAGIKEVIHNAYGGEVGLITVDRKLTTVFTFDTSNIEMKTQFLETYGQLYFILMKQKSIPVISFATDVIQAASDERNGKDRNRQTIEVIYINFERDYIGVANAGKMIDLITQQGDRGIYFTSPYTHKSENGNLVVTESAFYFFKANKSDAMLINRVSMGELGQVIKQVQPGDDVLYILQLPNAVDLVIRLKSGKISTSFEATINSLFIDNDIIRDISPTENFQHYVNQEKPSNRAKKDEIAIESTQLVALMKSTPRDIERIRNAYYSLRAKVEKDDKKNTGTFAVEKELLKRVNNFLESSTIHRRIIERLDRAFEESDATNISILFNFIDKTGDESLKAHKKSLEPQYIVMLNEKRMIRQLEKQLESFDKSGAINESTVPALLDTLIRAGKVEEYERYKEQYYNILQKVYLMSGVVGNTEPDSLTLLYQHAEQLELVSDPLFMDAKLKIPDVIKAREKQSELDKAVEDAAINGKTEHLTSLKLQYEKEGQKKLKEAAEKALQEVEKAAKYIEQLNNLVRDVIVDPIKYLDSLKAHFALSESFRHLRRNNSYKKVLSAAQAQIEKYESKRKETEKENAIKLRNKLRKKVDENNVEKAKEYLARINSPEFRQYMADIFQETVIEATKLVKENDVKQTLDSFIDKAKKDLLRMNDLKDIQAAVTDAYSYKNNQLLKKQVEQLQPTIVKLEAQKKKYDELVKLAECLDEAFLHELDRAKNVLPEELITTLQDIQNICKRDETSLKTHIMQTIKADNFSALKNNLEKAKRYKSLAILVAEISVRMPQPGQRKVSIKDKINLDVQAALKKDDLTELHSLYPLFEDLLTGENKKKVLQKMNSIRSSKETIEEYKMKLEYLISQLRAINLNDRRNRAKVVRLKQDLSKYLLLAGPAASGDDYELKQLVENGFALRNEIEKNDLMTTVSSIKDIIEQVENEQVDNTQSGGVKLLIDRDLLDPTEDLQVMLDFLDNNTSKVSHPLLGKLAKNIAKLEESFKKVQEVLDNQDVMDVSIGNPVGRNVVKAIVEVLSHNLKAKYFGGAPTVYEVLCQIKDTTVQSIITEFNNLKVIQALPQENKLNTLSILLVYYLLSKKDLAGRDYLSNAIEQFHASESSVASVYDFGSVMRDAIYRDELYNVLASLNKFTFKFVYASEKDLHIDHPLLKLKADVRALINHFVLNTKRASEIVEDEDIKPSQVIYLLGDDTWNTEFNKIGFLVRQKFCESLVKLLNNGLRKKYHLWQVIEETAEARKSSAIDLGGLKLPQAVKAVNDVFTTKAGNKFKDSYDLKLRSLICYSLNNKYLSVFIGSVFGESNLEVLKKYYDLNSAQVFQPWEVQVSGNSLEQKKVLVITKILEFLNTLRPLPFQLSLDAEIF